MTDILEIACDESGYTGPFTRSSSDPLSRRDSRDYDRDHRKRFSDRVTTVSEMIMRHMHPHSIMPDLDVIDPSDRSAAVNALIAYDLAKRAERRGDPYERLAEMYH